MAMGEAGAGSPSSDSSGHVTSSAGFFGRESTCECELRDGIKIRYAFGCQNASPNRGAKHCNKVVFLDPVLANFLNQAHIIHTLTKWVRHFIL